MNRKEIESLGFEFDSEAPATYFLRDNDIGLFASYPAKELEGMESIRKIISKVIQFEKNESFQSGMDYKANEIKKSLNL